MVLRLENILKKSACLPIQLKNVSLIQDGYQSSEGNIKLTLSAVGGACNYGPAFLVAHRSWRQYHLNRRRLEMGDSHSNQNARTPECGAWLNCSLSENYPVCADIRERFCISAGVRNGLPGRHFPNAGGI